MTFGSQIFGYICLRMLECIGTCVLLQGEGGERGEIGHTLSLAEYIPLASTPDGAVSSSKVCTYGSRRGANAPNIPLL